MAIEKKTFDELKNKFGDISSFAYWSDEKNVGDISFFQNDSIADKLNNQYIFVALNPSRPKTQGKNNKPEMFKNFHSDSANQKDFKLCYALKEIGVPFWGSYITDLFKRWVQVKSNTIEDYISKFPDKVKKDIEDLREEIRILSPNRKISIISLGSKTKYYLQKYLGTDWNIVNIYHYSYHYYGYSDKDKYCKKVKEDLKNAGLL